MDAYLDRVPPQNIDAEQSVLGAMLIDKEAVYKVMEILQPGDFYREAHNIIYRAVLNVNDKGQPVDLITVAEELRQGGNLEKVGGVAYVATLANLVPTAANVEYYARIVAEKALLRSLIQVSTRIASQGYEGNDAAQLMDEAERLILELGQRRNRGDFTAVKDILLNTFEYIEHVYNNKGQLTGLPTSFHDLDRLGSGLQPSDLIILAARPSMGKTSFGLNIAQNVALKTKQAVAIFSLEMSKEQLVQRMLCAEAMVDQYKLRTGNLEEEDWQRLTKVAGILAQAPIFIDDTPAITIGELRAKARRLKAEKGLALIVIDYLQLMQGTRTENRQQEISEISRSLKGLAKELNIPVIALSQLSRAVEQRQDKKPIMSDLRESGSLEQDADVVMFIYRDEYYHPDTEKRGIAEIIVAKHRNGPVGTIELGFLKEFTRFVNLSKDVEP